MKHKFGPVIAYRRYFVSGDADGATLVEVAVAAPVKSPHREDEFMCSFRVRSPASEQIETVYGIDALQALLLALGQIEASLHSIDRSSVPALRWVGGDAHDFGIRIPSFSGDFPSPRDRDGGGKGVRRKKVR